MKDSTVADLAVPVEWGFSSPVGQVPEAEHPIIRIRFVLLIQTSCTLYAPVADSGFCLEIICYIYKGMNS